MTMLAVPAPRVKGCLIQILMLFLINVPAVSFGLAMGWVSLASGEGGAGEDDAALVGAAAATFAAGLLGVPLSARALRAGRKPALIATSAAFGVCWALKLLGGWGVLAGRLAAGVAGAAAWSVAPLMAREMCSPGLRGAGVAALVLAHNLGLLLMYVAADQRLHHRTAEAWCLALAVLHCAACLFTPESPAFLAAQGNFKAARAALARLRGVHAAHPALAAELGALPPRDDAAAAPCRLVRDLLSDRRRRRALAIAAVAVVGQEACGVLSLLQFAERVFVLARGEGPGEGEVSPARLAVVVGAVQLAASGLALYLVERVGRRPLLIWGALATGGALAAAAALVGVGAAGGTGGAGGAASALAIAVAADALGLQPAPYALLADMFHYQYRGCAVLLVTALSCGANAAETLIFPSVARAGGLAAALALAAGATLALAAFAAAFVPETRGRDPDEIYDIICPGKPGAADAVQYKLDTTDAVNQKDLHPPDSSHVYQKEAAAIDSHQPPSQTNVEYNDSVGYKDLPCPNLMHVDLICRMEPTGLGSHQLTSSDVECDVGVCYQEIDMKNGLHYPNCAGTGQKETVVIIGDESTTGHRCGDYIETDIVAPSNVRFENRMQKKIAFKTVVGKKFEPSSNNCRQVSENSSLEPSDNHRVSLKHSDNGHVADHNARFNGICEIPKEINLGKLPSKSTIMRNDGNTNHQLLNDGKCSNIRRETSDVDIFEENRNNSDLTYHDVISSKMPSPDVSYLDNSCDVTYLQTREPCAEKTQCTNL